MGFLSSNGATKDYNYGVFLGNTFKSFPNITWQSGNDYMDFNSSNDSLVKGIADGIRSVLPNSIQSLELFSDTANSAAQEPNLSTDDSYWVGFLNLNGAYTYFSPYATVLRGYDFEPGASRLRNGVQLRVREQQRDQLRI